MVGFGSILLVYRWSIFFGSMSNAMDLDYAGENL
jgi:hypothetical protein